jgi:hypothetical protein
MRAEALNGSTELLSRTVDVDQTGQVAFSFVATGNTTTIKFSDTTTSGNYDINLDSVKLLR